MAKKSGNARLAVVHGFFGATGSGKTYAALQTIQGARGNAPLFVWSPKEPADNYCKKFGLGLAKTASKMVQIGSTCGGVVYQPKLDDSDKTAFDIFCKLAAHCAPCIVVVDELHTVTQAGRAPSAWKRLVMMGRSAGVQVYGISQRPASVDKDFISNLSAVWCGRLNYADDVQTLAKLLNVRRETVEGLQGHKAISRNMHTGEVSES